MLKIETVRQSQREAARDAFREMLHGEDPRGGLEDYSGDIEGGGVQDGERVGEAGDPPSLRGGKRGVVLGKPMPSYNIRLKSGPGSKEGTDDLINWLKAVHVAQLEVGETYDCDGWDFMILWYVSLAR